MPAKYTRVPVVDRFWAKVARLGPDDCWIWQASVTHDGYGRLWNEGRTRLAHKIAWELANGRPVPDDLDILHTCPGGDNKRCVNAAHLRVGTALENKADAKERGQIALGIHHGLAKLTPDIVRQIRAKRANGVSVSALARAHCVARSTVHQLLTRRTWRHVA